MSDVAAEINQNAAFLLQRRSQRSQALTFGLGLRGRRREVLDLPLRSRSRDFGSRKKSDRGGDEDARSERQRLPVRMRNGRVGVWRGHPLRAHLREQSREDFRRSFRRG